MGKIISFTLLLMTVTVSCLFSVVADFNRDEIKLPLEKANWVTCSLLKIANDPEQKEVFVTKNQGLQAHWNGTSSKVQFLLEPGILYPIIPHPETNRILDNGKIRICQPNDLSECGWVEVKYGCRKK